MQQVFDSLIGKLKRAEENKNRINDDLELDRPPPAINKKSWDESNDPVFNVIKLPAVFAMVGAPKSGKTHCMKHLLIHYLLNGELQFGLVFTGTKFSKQFDFITDDNLIISGYNEDTLKKFLTKLRDYRLQKNKPAKAFIVIDDMIGQVPWESGLILHLFTTYRWYGLSIFLSTQYIYKINPTVRTVSDYAFIWSQDNGRCLEAVYESFGLSFDNFKHFKDTLDAIVSERHSCMLFNKDERKLDDRYKGYKAPATIPEVRFRFSKQKQEQSF